MLTSSEFVSEVSVPVRSLSCSRRGEVDHVRERNAAATASGGLTLIVLCSLQQRLKSREASAMVDFFAMLSFLTHVVLISLRTCWH